MTYRYRECTQCSAVIRVRKGQPGPDPTYCSRRCRQVAYRRRHRTLAPCPTCGRLQPVERGEVRCNARCRLHAAAQAATWPASEGVQAA